jgi:hypothetical protein
MKRSILLLIVFFSATLFTFSQSNYKQLIAEGDRLYNSKEFVKAKEVYILAFQQEMKDKTDLYKAACASALAGDRENAFKLLNLSIENGFVNLSHLKSDTDLVTLHSRAEWDQLLAKLQVKLGQNASDYNQEAATILKDVYKTDQGLRTELSAAEKAYGFNSAKTDSLLKLMLYHDSLNTIAVTRILDEYGWLGADQVGDNGNSTLFLVIQHSNLKIQQKYLPMLQKAVREKKANSRFLALLEDRVAMREGKKQLYGSQLLPIPDQPGKYYLSPLIDPDNVDKRRALIGLNPIAEYVKTWDIVWDVERYKKMLPQYEEWARRIKW